LASSGHRLALISPEPAVKLYKQKLAACASQLEILSVESALNRGFAVARRNGKSATAADIAAGDEIVVEFRDGSVEAEARKVSLNRKF